MRYPLNSRPIPSPYSDDLRQKVLDAIDSGHRKSHVSQMFNISHNTIDLWLKRRKQTESFSAMRHYRRGLNPLVTMPLARHSGASDSRVKKELWLSRAR